MANYVYNRILCRKEVLDRYFLDRYPIGMDERTDEPYVSFNKLFGAESLGEYAQKYGVIVSYDRGANWEEKPDGTCEIKFTTRRQYPIRAIVRAIELSHDTQWFAVEENRSYVSRFYWADGVQEDVLDIGDAYAQWSAQNEDFTDALADWDDGVWHFLPTAPGDWQNWESTDGFARYTGQQASCVRPPWESGGDDMDSYWYCAVDVQGASSLYSYISDFGQIEEGTFVEVPFGAQNVKRFGMVVRCRLCTKENAPYPVEKTKHVIRIADASEIPVQTQNHSVGEYGAYTPRMRDDPAPWICIRLGCADVHLRIVGYYRSKTEDYYDQWCELELSAISERYGLHYSVSSLNLLCGEVETLRDCVEKHLNGGYTQSTTVETLDEEIRFVFGTEYTTMDLQLILWDEGPTDNYYSFCLNRDELEKLLVYLRLILRELTPGTEEVRNLIDADVIRPITGSKGRRRPIKQLGEYLYQTVTVLCDNGKSFSGEVCSFGCSVAGKENYGTEESYLEINTGGCITVIFEHEIIRIEEN